MRFSKEMYPKIALIKSAYAYTDKAYVHLDSDDAYYYVDLVSKPGCQKINENEFANEMMCQCARHEVYSRTKELRELLVARAMASTVVRLSDEQDVDSAQQARPEQQAQAERKVQPVQASTEKQADTYAHDVQQSPSVDPRSQFDGTRGKGSVGFTESEILADWFVANAND